MQAEVTAWRYISHTGLRFLAAGGSIDAKLSKRNCFCMDIFDIAIIIVVAAGVVLSLARKQELYALLSLSIALILFSIQDVTQHQYWLAASTLLLSIIPIVIGVLHFKKAPR